MFWNLRTRSASFARWHALVGRALVALAVLPCLSGPARAETKATASAFVVGGNPVRVEHFLPAGAGQHPAVLLLPSSEGMAERDAATYRYAARLLARQGYVALLVHYFDSTNITRVDRKDIDARRFRAWMGAVRGAVRHTAGLPAVDRERIGLVGISLGACLALAVAGEEGGPRVAAVVDLFGCLPQKLAGSAAGLPPTLVLQGAIFSRREGSGGKSWIVSRGEARPAIADTGFPRRAGTRGNARNYFAGARRPL
jgi:dienelactone hydrolase